MTIVLSSGCGSSEPVSGVDGPGAQQPAQAASAHTADGDDSDWTGRPTFLGGVATYNAGEFIYSDFIHDDYGANIDTVEGGEGDPPQPITGIWINLNDPASPRFGSLANGLYSRFQRSGDYGYPARSTTEPVSFDPVADIVEFRVATSPDRLHLLVPLADLITRGENALWHAAQKRR